MTQEKIVEMLKKPAKPDLEAAKKFALEDESNTFRIYDPSAVKHWKEAASLSAAKAMCSKLASPAIRMKDRRAFYDGFYRHQHRDEIEAAMKKAGVEEWQKYQPADSVTKIMKPEDFQCYLSVYLGSTRYRGDDNELYAEALPWSSRRETHWPNFHDSHVSQEFLGALEAGNRSATKLAELGYQNVLECDDVVVFIKLPKQVHIDMIRTRYMLSNPNGPAYVGHRKVYAFRGVRIEDEPHTWQERSAVNHDASKLRKLDDKAVFERYFADGKLKLSVKEVLNTKNTELRRVFMETFEAEEILKECDARLLSKETDKDGNINELFSVDIGLGEQHRIGNLLWGDPKEEWGRYATRAQMLRYTCPSTGRVYAKFVPFEMQTANEAQAWGHHMTLTEYANDLVDQS